MAQSPYYGRPAGTATPAPVPQLLSKTGMELTPEVRQLLTETAKSLRVRARRLFMARAVRALGSGGRQKAERELGWRPEVRFEEGIRRVSAWIQEAMPLR